MTRCWGKYDVYNDSGILVKLACMAVYGWRYGYWRSVFWFRRGNE
jgi:hypothetical protein